MKTLLLSALGFIFLSLGIVGIAVPVMPTTPFVLLSAMCFSVGNERVSGWLRQNPIFGPYLENYRTKQGISRKLKISSIAFVWAGLGISMVTIQNLQVCLMLSAVGAGVTLHLLMIKTKIN